MKLVVSYQRAHSAHNSSSLLLLSSFLTSTEKEQLNKVMFSSACVTKTWRISNPKHLDPHRSSLFLLRAQCLFDIMLSQILSPRCGRIAASFSALGLIWLPPELSRSERWNKWNLFVSGWKSWINNVRLRRGVEKRGSVSADQRDTWLMRNPIRSPERNCVCMKHVMSSM